MWHVLRQQCGVAGGSALVSDDIHDIGAPFVCESAVIGKRALSKYSVCCTEYGVLGSQIHPKINDPLDNLNEAQTPKLRYPAADELRCRGQPLRVRGTDYTDTFDQ